MICYWKWRLLRWCQIGSRTKDGDRQRFLKPAMNDCSSKPGEGEMKLMYFSLRAFLFLMIASLFSVPLFAAETAALQKAKKDAETRGFMFIANRDEIIA